MKKNITSILLIILISLIACKKTQSPSSSNAGNTANTTNTGIYGVFSSSKEGLISNNVITNQPNYSYAFHSINPFSVNEVPMSSIINMGTVSLNGITLRENYGNSPNNYFDTTNNVYITPHQWQVGGNTMVSSFSYTNTTPYPIYTGYASIADSFIIANGISIPLINYSSADMIDFYFCSNDIQPIFSSVQTVTANVTSLNFDAQSLSAFGSGKIVNFYIRFYKNNVQNINGKNYNFVTAYEIMKANIKFK